jgi:NDP-sugar pyrophosphorylase family protein
MKAMVLAAGVGSRLDPLTRCSPKPMVPVVNRPVIEHIIGLLRRHGCDDLVLNLHYLGEQIAAYVDSGERFGVRLRCEREDQLWGDAGSVKRVADFFDATFLVIGGDALCDTDLGALIRFHHERRALATIGLFPVDDPSEYGIVEADEEGRVIRFLEKPKATDVFSRSANMGMYVLEPAALEFIPPGTPFGFGRQLLPLLLEKGQPVYGHVSRESWRDIGSFPEYRQAHWDAMAGHVSVQVPGIHQRAGVWIGEESEVDATATIGTSVVVGRRCRIGAGCTIGDFAVLGDGCVIGAGAAVRQTILWNDVEIAAGTVLEGCIVTHGAKVSADPALFQAIVAPAARPN